MKRLPKLMWWRHAVRVLVLLALVLVAGLNLHRRYKSQHGGQFEIQAHRGLRLIDKAKGSSPHMDRRPIVVSGGLWSFKAGPVRASDPLAVLSGALTSRKLSIPLLLSALIPLAAILIGGRLYCSWICPMGLLSELVRSLRRKLAKVGVHFINISVSGLPKYILLVLGALVCLLLSVPFFYGIYPPRMISDALGDIWTGDLMKFDVIFVGVVLLCELLLCERLWCKCLCPGGALFAWLGSIRKLRVHRDPESCTACGACDPACPYDLEPARNALGGECDNCGLCMEACNDDALAYYVKPPKFRSSSLMLLLGASLMLMTAVPVAQAHHIRGIPHYSYQENYPQAPLFEEFRDSGPWTLQFTFWPVPTQKALDLALYVKHVTTGEPYDGPVTFRVYQHGEDLGEDNHPFAATANPRHIHKVGWVYEEDGVYYAEITVGEGDQAVSETFQFQVGVVKPNYLLLGSVTAAILVLIASVAIIKKRQMAGSASTT
jgi:ferredoxin-type protein NapH